MSSAHGAPCQNHRRRDYPRGYCPGVGRLLPTAKAGRTSLSPKLTALSQVLNRVGGITSRRQFSGWRLFVANHQSGGLGTRSPPSGSKVVPSRQSSSRSSNVFILAAASRNSAISNKYASSSYLKHRASTRCTLDRFSDKVVRVAHGERMTSVKDDYCAPLKGCNLLQPRFRILRFIGANLFTYGKALHSALSIDPFRDGDLMAIE